jgi:hypothetical protein
MGSLPPMDLIQELVIIAKHIKQKKYSIAYENLSDMTSLLTASTVGETDLMLLELVFRDEIKNFDTSLKMLLNNESKVIEKNSGKNSEPNSG